MSSERFTFLRSACSRGIMSEQWDERKALQREPAQPQGSLSPTPRFLTPEVCKEWPGFTQDPGVAFIKITYNSSAFPYWSQSCISCSPFSVMEGVYSRKVTHTHKEREEKRRGETLEILVWKRNALGTISYKVLLLNRQLPGSATGLWMDPVSDLLSNLYWDSTEPTSRICSVNPLRVRFPHLRK